MFTAWLIMLMVLGAIVFGLVIFVLLGTTIVRSTWANRRHRDQEDVPRL